MIVQSQNNSNLKQLIIYKISVGVLFGTKLEPREWDTRTLASDGPWRSGMPLHALNNNCSPVQRNANWFLKFEFIF